MITIYNTSGEAATISSDINIDSFSDDIVWIDVLNPSFAENELLDRVLGLHIPRYEELKFLAPSSRMYTDNGNVYMTASVILRAHNSNATLTDIGAILAGNRFVTIRYDHTSVFDLFLHEFNEMEEDKRQGNFLILKLMDVVTAHTADVLEQAVIGVDKVAAIVFGNKSRGKRKASNFLEARVGDLVGLHRVLSKVRESMGSISRINSYLHGIHNFQKDESLREFSFIIANDIQAITDNATFISSNLAFLLDATLGIISTEQNAIIKIFSIVSVVFLPPTLIASIYGMNFKNMPELHWGMGYPITIVLMLLTACIPYLVFRKKGWL